MKANDIMIRKSYGNWSPSGYLSNLSIAYFEEPSMAARRVLPIVPVNLPSGHYYEFSRDDLARNQTQLKPPFGSVSPAIFGISEKSYSCKVAQVLVGYDELQVRPYQVMQTGFDPLRARVRTVTEQLNQHLEIEFAQKLFNANAWTNVWTGNSTENIAQKKFIKFSNANSDPVAFLDARMTDVRRVCRRKPNKLALGIEAFNALKNHDKVKDRIKYSGTTQNPAVVTEQVLAQILGLDSVVVLDATVNSAGFGEPANMNFICDSKSALLLYAPDNPMIDEPSAGYIFAWNFNGSSDYIAISEVEGAPASHANYLEGLLSYDIRKTSDDLAVFLTDCA